MPHDGPLLDSARFLLPGSWWDPLRTMLADDIRSARLSRTFRAYYRLRKWIPIRVRQWLQSRRGQSASLSEHWYLPASDFYRQLHDELPNLAQEVHWPHGAQWAFILTHDVETSAGMKLIAPLAEIEESLGLRSSWNIVPYKYPVDRGLLRDLQARGFEIGVHGYNHDGLLFWSEATFRQRSEAINRILVEWGAVGFRAPFVHRHLPWIDQYLDIEYDASCFDVDPLQAMPGGIGGIWPFVFGRFVELPYTMPQDHTLFIALGERSDRIWRDKLEFIRRFHGMALMLTHPDYLDTAALRDLYRGFLEHALSQPRHWHVLPRAAAGWCRDRTW